jgi:hypothetical protein
LRGAKRSAYPNSTLTFCCIAVRLLLADFVEEVGAYLRLLRPGCVSACKKDPHFGVIGIQSGPQHRGPTLASVIHGSGGWDAGRGDDCEDSPRVFCTGPVDQGDLSRAESLTEGRTEGLFDRKRPSFVMSERRKHFQTLEPLTSAPCIGAGYIAKLRPPRIT